MSPVTVPVLLGGRAYDVVVGSGVRGELAGLVSTKVPGARLAAVVTQPAIGVEVEVGIPVIRLEVDDGEGAKSLATVEDLCRRFARAGLSRGDLVVAVGGGVVTDVAGFAAAAYHRGVAYVNVATSLLAQVDAAIGGKTGVNLPEGKNLVGAFWQPSAVVCDTEVLATLPEREWRSGRGEMAKYAFLGTGTGTGTGALGLLELTLEEQVAHCVAVKAAVVASDEREGDRRAVLNYGHTLAHALEAAGFGELGGPGRGLRHGEAVAVGLVFAAELAHRLGRVEASRVDEHRRVVTAFGLPTALPGGVDPAYLVELMRRDKKAHHDLTFVLDGPHGVEVVRGVDPDVVLATLDEMERAA